MVWKLMSVTFALVLIVVTILFFRIDIPMCYNTTEPEQQEPFVLYAQEVVEEIQTEIEENPFNYINIVGRSMSPSIRDGDICVCVPKTNYDKGDIISFYVPVDNQVELIIHRIVEEGNNQFRTKGDNNDIKDAWIVEEEQIFCQVPEKTLFDKFKFAVVESEGRFSIFSLFEFE